MSTRVSTQIAFYLSVILFCFGVGLWGFFRLTQVDQNKSTDVYQWVPDDCIGVVESDNMDFFMNEFLHVEYNQQLDTLRNMGFIKTILTDLVSFNHNHSHGLKGNMNNLIISFHTKGDSRDVVAYFKVGKETRRYFDELLGNKYGVGYIPRKENYRGMDIYIYPIENDNYISVCCKNGVIAVSSQMRLIERVIDAKKDGSSLRKNANFNAMYQTKSENFLTLYGHTPSIPKVATEGEDYWSDYNVNMNSGAFYLSGSTYGDSTNSESFIDKLKDIPTYRSDSVLVVCGQEKVDSTISTSIIKPNPELFDKCISGLSRDASAIMVLDMEKCVQNPEEYKAYMPPLMSEYPWLFRSFILSVQLSVVDDKAYHIFIFTYKS